MSHFRFALHASHSKTIKRCGFPSANTTELINRDKFKNSVFDDYRPPEISLWPPKLAVR